MKKLKSTFMVGLLLAVYFSNTIAAEFSQVRPTAETLLELPVTDWLSNGGDLYNRNFSPLTQINTTNVDQLGPVWRTHL